jgi:hypothetical protein
MGGRGTIFNRTPGSKYLVTEGRETPQEIQDSKRSQGAGMEAAKNKAGYTYAWLIYDFAVGSADLKPGHKAFLSKLSPAVGAYGRTHNKSGTVLIAGFASPSGVHGDNVALAEKRARNVRDYLVMSGRLPAAWCFLRDQVSSSDIYAVVKGTPATPQQRSLCRGVYVVLWLARDIPTSEKFSEVMRQKARSQIPNRFGKYEEQFYYWVLDNWTYLVKPENGYVRLAYPSEHGLFFKEPSAPLTNDRDVWAYLRGLHGQFKDALHRLKHQYTGVPGHSGVPAGGDPVRCYQQLARWIALDGHARGGSNRVFHFTEGQAVQTSFNELIEMVNGGRKFGDPNTVWTKIEAYMKSKRIPLRVVRQPVR